MAKSFIPPRTVAKQAELGLKLREKFGKGGTEIGIARARELKARRAVSVSTIKRMVSYFARHEVDKDADNFGRRSDPSKGYIAWLLWGGEAGKRWAENKAKTIDSK